MPNYVPARDLSEPTGQLRQGFVARADANGARFVPWYEADTVGAVGSSRIKRRRRAPVRIGPPEGSEVIRTTDRQKAERLARMLFLEVEKMRYILGREPVAADLSAEMLRAIGGELWKAGEPVTFDKIRAVATRYIEASRRGNPETDIRFSPGSV